MTGQPVPSAPIFRPGSVSNKRRVFPFTQVVGQEEMKLALLLNVIDPRIGGVMIMGDRGMGKSTTIRALVAAFRLRHRLRKDPLETIDTGDRVVKVFCQVFERPLPSGEGEHRAFELALAQ